MPDAPRFRVTREGGVAVLWIDNPPRNLLSLSMVADLASRVVDLEKDDSIRAAVVSGAGHANFCAGLDMSEWSRLSPKAAQDEMSRGQDAFWALEHLTKPTIAAIAGEARGAGAELAFACDLRIADESAVFAHPEIDLGWMHSHGATARLSKLVGRSRALEILFFFQAEDGIRDADVTGVQTCALPIFEISRSSRLPLHDHGLEPRGISAGLQRFCVERQLVIRFDERVRQLERLVARAVREDRKSVV